MKRVLPVILFGAAIVALWILWRDTGQGSHGLKPPTREATPIALEDHLTTVSAPVTYPQPPQPLLGESILRGYGDTNQSPAHDLVLLSHLMENSLLLLKSAANRPLSANEDWAALLWGGNSARERFLPANHVVLNAKGQLVDRWQTPLFFHALGDQRFAIRSAGPDRKLWTEDDIQRNPDGSFARGELLNPPSLFESPVAQP